MVLSRMLKTACLVDLAMGLRGTQWVGGCGGSLQNHPALLWETSKTCKTQQARMEQAARAKKLLTTEKMMTTMIVVHVVIDDGGW